MSDTVNITVNPPTDQTANIAVNVSRNIPWAYLMVDTFVYTPPICLDPNATNCQCNSSYNWNGTRCVYVGGGGGGT